MHFTAFRCKIGSLSSDVFERRTSTRSEPFPLLISLDATVFVLPSVLILIETICPKICSKSRLKCAKSPFPVDVRRSKTSLKFGHAQKAKFAFSPPLFFHFSCLIFFSLAGHLVGFILVGRVFGKAFRILGLGERKGRWAIEQDFSCRFSGQSYMVFCLFLPCP